MFNKEVSPDSNPDMGKIDKECQIDRLIAGQESLVMLQM